MEKMTIEQAAALLLTSAEAIHVTDCGGRILWAGTRQQFQEGGTDRDGRQADTLRGLPVEAIGAAWDAYAGRAAVILAVRP